MNNILVVLIPDCKCNENAVVWDVDNKHFLVDMFKNMGFVHIYLIKEKESELKKTNLRVIKSAQIKQKILKDEFIGLLFVNERSVIANQDKFISRIKHAVDNKTSAFNMKRMIRYVNTNDYTSYGQEIDNLNDTFEDIDYVYDINGYSGYEYAVTKYRRQIVNKHLKAGVVFLDPGNSYIGYNVKIQKGTMIYPGCFIEGKTVIGENSIIGPDTMLKNVEIGNNTTVMKSVITDSKIGCNCNIGPFSYIRPGSCVSDDVKVGDFVELKNSKIGDKTKIPHLAYIGDSNVGGNTNIACGVITANYDGKQKYKTIIGRDSFIGCNVNLVAPVKVNKGAYIAAGSTITDEVPSNSLAIARKRQTVKENWVIKKGLQRSEE